MSGMGLTRLIPFTGQALKPSASTADKCAGVYGVNIKNFRGCAGGGTAANQNAIVDTISRWLGRAGLPLNRAGPADSPGRAGPFTLITPPEKTNTGPGFNRGSGSGARGCGLEERGGAHARTEGGHFL